MIYTRRRRRLSNQIKFNLKYIEKYGWKTRPSRTTSISNKHHHSKWFEKKNYFLTVKRNVNFIGAKKKLMFHQLRRYDNKILMAWCQCFENAWRAKIASLKCWICNIVWYYSSVWCLLPKYTRFLYFYTLFSSPCIHSDFTTQ